MLKLISTWINDVQPSRISQLITAIDAADEVIVFGSRAAGVAKRASDLDVLCIGSGSGNVNDDVLDLLWIDRARSLTEEWLESELATHMAKYGVVVKGGSGWASGAHISTKTIKKKQIAIERALHALRTRGSFLRPRFYEKHLLSIRRDVLRLRRLESGIAVPATPLLDAALQSVPSDLDAIRREILKFT